jgi:phage gp36-like protein
MASYADSDDMVARYDENTLKQLVRDDGVSEVMLSTNVKMTTALSTATGKVRASLLRGKRYTTDDLDGLTGESLEFLKDIVCRIAFWVLWQRKPYTSAQDTMRQEAKEQADEFLNLLKTGQEIFEIDTHIAAGLPDASAVSATTVKTNWQLAVDRCRPRFYPARRSTFP